MSTCVTSIGRYQVLSLQGGVCVCVFHLVTKINDIELTSKLLIPAQFVLGSCVVFGPLHTSYFIESSYH